MTLLATTRVEDLQLVNTETGQRRDVVPHKDLWPADDGDYRLWDLAPDGKAWFTPDGLPWGGRSVWRIERRAVDADAELVKLAREALEPFANFARHAVDENGWSSTTQRERIVDWFGPSQFREALKAIAALDALILTPPVDPVKAEAALIEAEWAGCETLGEMLERALKRGLELAERGEG